MRYLCGLPAVMMLFLCCCIFFFKRKTAYEMRISAGSSDVFSADLRFANRKNQWEYPAQLFAERGYVVLLINEPSARENAEVWAARLAWRNETKAVAPETMRQLIWLNGVASYEDAVRSEEHTSELQSLMRISYAVFCLEKKKKQKELTSQTKS